MRPKKLQDLEEQYELELEKAVKTIKKEKAKRVLLQIPDGLKPYATEIQDKIQELLGEYKCEIFLWLDTCFGACDIPTQVESLGVDLIVQFGHSAWDYSSDKKIKIV
jgi:2-(3-amino-3-carboxypropyl)histidine synthase